jgi:hypothetical protein
MKKLTYAALASILFIGCQQTNLNPETGNETKGETKKVVVSINQAKVSTRANTSQVVEDGDITPLTDGILFFFNEAGATVLSYTLTSEQIENGQAVVADVPSSAKSVAMIANVTDDISSTTPTTFAEFKAIKIGIDEQATPAGLIGYADTDEKMPNAVQGLALLDRAGANTANTANALIEVTGSSDFTHTVTITLVPAVARLQVGGIQVKTDNATNLVDFKLAGIYINNYANEYTLGMTRTDSISFQGAAPNEVWLTQYMTKQTATNRMYDNSNLLVTTGDPVGSFAYHLFPGTAPHLIIGATDLDYDNTAVGFGDIAGPRYWLVDTYRNANDNSLITSFDPGKVYSIATIVVGNKTGSGGDNETPRVDPYIDPLRVQVTLDVQDWLEQPVTVSPKK